MNAPLPTDPLVTKNGVRVRVGQIWRDLDKRMGENRLRKIAAIVDETNGRVLMIAAQGRGRFPSKVSIRRMHRHSTGWELVTDV